MPEFSHFYSLWCLCVCSVKIFKHFSCMRFFSSWSGKVRYPSDSFWTPQSISRAYFSMENLVLKLKQCTDPTWLIFIHEEWNMAVQEPPATRIDLQKVSPRPTPTAAQINSLVKGVYLRKRPCPGPEWWTVCRCDCSVNHQRCPGRCQASNGSLRFPAPGGSCCTGRRPSCPSSPRAPPSACSHLVFRACRCPPDRASTPRQCFQSRSESMEDYRDTYRKPKANNAPLFFKKNVVVGRVCKRRNCLWTRNHLANEGAWL